MVGVSWAELYRYPIVEFLNMVCYWIDREDARRRERENLRRRGF